MERSGWVSCSRRAGFSERDVSTFGERAVSTFSSTY